MSSSNGWNARNTTRVRSFMTKPMFFGIALVLTAVVWIVSKRGPAWWWALPAFFILKHVVLLLAAVFGTGGAARMWRRHFRHGDDAEHSHPATGILIREPRKYDFHVQLLSLGFEGRLRRWVVRLGGVRSGDAVLDVGCGTGTLLGIVARDVESPLRLCGVDAASEMVEYACRKAEANGVSMQLQVASADRLPYPDGSFDVAFCTFVIHHLPANMRTEALHEIRRVLRPGGKIVIADFCRPRIPVSLPWLLHTARHRIPHQSDLIDVDRLSSVGFESVGCQRTWTGAIGAWTGIAAVSCA